MRTRVRALVATAAAVAATVLAGPATAAHASGTAWGCKSGWVCIYADTKEFSPITNSYFNYGTYNLHNQFDVHDIVNNQTGHATVSLCYGFNGVNCTIAPLLTYDDCVCTYAFDLTPINSIKLNRP